MNKNVYIKNKKVLTFNENFIFFSRYSLYQNCNESHFRCVLLEEFNGKETLCILTPDILWEKNFLRGGKKPLYPFVIKGAVNILLVQSYTRIGIYGLIYFVGANMQSDS